MNEQCLRAEKICTKDFVVIFFLCVPPVVDSTTTVVFSPFEQSSFNAVLEKSYKIKSKFIMDLRTFYLKKNSIQTDLMCHRPRPQDRVFVSTAVVTKS